MLEEAGFTRVDAMDKSDLFVETMKREISQLESIKESFIEASAS